jgi:hypothetical protein
MTRDIDDRHDEAIRSLCRSIRSGWDPETAVERQISAQIKQRQLLRMLMSGDNSN